LRQRGRSARPRTIATDKEVFMPDRERIDTGNDKRYVRRDEQGQFDEVEDVGRSSAQDQRRDAEHEARAGQGDRGDRTSGERGRNR
jgi:hypothetical protein